MTGIPRRLSEWSRSRAATRSLVLVRVVVLVSVLAGVPSYPSAAATRYQDIARSTGTPYRDHQVEFAPGELAIAELVGRSGPSTARMLLALLAFAGDLGAFLALRKGWGTTTAQRYLWLGLPLLIFIYRRADLVTVAVAVAAVLWARIHREGAAGIAMAVAFLTRLWPVILTPIWVIERRRRALWVFASAASAGVVAWIAFGGIGAIGQVSSFRGASGWELESSVGVVVWALTGEHRFESGANRTGMVPGWAGPLTLALLIAIFALVWLRASRIGSDPAGGAALAAVASLLALSPLLSPQYASWLLPWGAIAGGAGRRWSIAAAIPIVLTGAVVAGWYLDLGLGAGRDQIILFLRNGALVAIVVAYFVWSEDPTVRAPAR